MKNIISSHISSRIKSLSIKLKVFILPAVALVALALVLNASHSPSKAELRFAETSPAGPSAGAVLPASCESGYAHFAGACIVATVAPVVPVSGGGGTYCGIERKYWGPACSGLTGQYLTGDFNIVYNDTPGWTGAHTASCNGTNIQLDTPADFPQYAGDPNLIYPYCNQVRFDPMGSFDLINTAHVAQGWSIDKDTPAAGVTIHFYLEGVMIGLTNADTSRPDVGAAFGLGNNHGFSWPIPNGYCNGTTRYLYAYAIDTTGYPSNPLLAGSPKPFNCIAAGPTITVARSPWSNIPAGTSGALSWATAYTTNLALTCTGPDARTVPSVTPLSGSVSKTYGASIAGTTACTWTATGPGGTSSYSETFTVASGALTMSSNTCTIATGQSTCTVNASWTTVNAVSPSLKDDNTGATLSSFANGSALPVYVTGGVGTTFKLYSGPGLLDAKTVTGVCATGSVWSGASCLAPSVQINSAVVDDSDNLSVNYTCRNSNSYEVWITKPTPSVMVASGPIPGASFANYTGTVAYSLNAILAASSTLKKVDVTIKCKNGPTAEASLIATDIIIPSRAPAVINRFSVNPVEVVCGGGKVTLAWDVQYSRNKNCKIIATSSRDISTLSSSDRNQRNADIATINAYLNTSAYSSKSGAGNNVSTSTAFNTHSGSFASKADLSNINIKHSTKFTLTCNPNVSVSQIARVVCVSEN